MTEKMIEKIGVKNLDDILDGGVPLKSIVLVEGTPGIGKDILAYQFLFTGLNNKEECAIVFAGRTTAEIERDFLAYGMRIDTSAITWINAGGITEPEKDKIINCDISELYTISNAIKKFLDKNKKKKMRLIFTVLSSALMSNPVQEVYKFFSSLVETFKKYNVTVFVLLEDGMHDPQTVVSIEQLCDGVIDMKAYERGWDIQPMLRIKKMRALPIPLKYFRFTVTNKGVIVVC